MKTSHSRQVALALVSTLLLLLFLAINRRTPPLLAEASHEIRLQRATFDPLYAMPTLPPGLELDAPLPDGAAYYLVQFRGPILPEWRAALEGEGATITDYVPQFAYVVRMDGATAARVRALAPVRWAGPYQPAFRLSTDLDAVVAGGTEGEIARITVRSFPGESSQALAAQLEAAGADVQAVGDDSGGGAIYKVEIAAASIPAVARLNGVAWVEPWAEPRLYNEITRSPLIFDKDGVEASLGLYGAGQVVVVGDTGVSTGNESTMHPDFQGHFYKGTWGSGSCASWSDYYAHGTHVAGSVLGNGIQDGAAPATHNYAGTNAGIAPEASLWAWAFCSDWSGLPDSDPYNDYYGVMYDDSSLVRINTNSWGYSAPSGTYDSFSRETDRFIWDHPDMVVLFAASNDGTDGNSDGVVDDDSLGVPAGAKNIVTVGASENYRLSGGYNPGGACSTWGTCWPFDYPANPVRDDRLSDDPLGMVAFSSRGPVDDGRLKPDIVAPGSNVVSTRHQPGSADPLWGVYDDWYSYCGGTSMSTPLAAGASAIVREFYAVTYGLDPTAALVKATLINGAQDMSPGQYRDEVPDGSKDDVIRRPDINQGWGRIDLSTSLVYALPRALWFEEHETGLLTGEEYSTTLSISGNSTPFRVTLAWSDYPGSEATDGALVNDLDLEILGPGGTTYHGNDILDGVLDGDVDHVNNVEGIDLDPQPGAYVVYVRGYNVPQGPQPFALVASGEMGEVGYLDGTVYDGTLGGGLADASLRIVSDTLKYRATTGASGYYSLPVAADTYTVSAWKYGYTLEEVPGVTVVSDTVTTQDITLAQTPAYSLTGCVTDSVTGDPLAAEISVSGPFGDAIAETSAPQASGCYSLTLYGGPYSVRAEALLHHQGTAAVDLSSNTVLNFGLVPLTTEGLLWGEINSQATGDPVQGATVQVSPGLTSTQSGPGGYYEMLLPPGTYTVAVSAPLYSTVEEAGVVVPQSNLVRRDYALPTAHMELSPPGGIAVALRQGEQAERTLVVSNTGEGSLDFEIVERDRGFVPGAAAPLNGADVLVVNRSSSNAAAAIEAALTALAHSYLEVNEATFRATPVVDLLDYELLIWAGTTGGSGGDNDNEAHLTAYLDAGGAILHTDNDLGYFRDGSTYYDNYLHAEYGLDDATNTDSSPQLVNGLDLMAPLVVDLTSEPYPDGVLPRDGAAAPLFAAQDPADPDYPYLGLRIESGAYRAIYFAFDFNYVEAGLQTDLMQRAYGWLATSDIAWLTEEPAAGTVAASGDLSVTLTFDAATVTETGTYEGMLRFETNDPGAQPWVEYPVAMQVIPLPPEFAIAKAASADRVEVGLPLVYTLTVTNDGGAASSVVVSDSLPADTHFAWANGGGTLLGGDVVWDGLTLPASSSLSVSYGVTVSCVASGTEIANTGYQVLAAEWPTPTTGTPVTVTTSSDGAVASFDWSPRPALLDWPVAFANLSANATAYEWDLGDGTHTEAAEPVHSYSGAPADYTVVLTASNLCAQDVSSQLLTVVDYAVEVSPAESSGSGDPGQVVSYTLWVTNAGTYSDILQLTVVGDDWSTQLATDTVELDAGEGQAVLVGVTVPPQANAGASDQAYVLVRSLSDPRTPAATAAAELTTVARAVYSVSLGPPLSSGATVPGETVTYTLQVTNTSNAVDTIAFTRVAPGWPTAFSVPSMVIAAGGRRQIKVYVTVPPGASAALPDVAVIRATGSGNSAEVTLTTTTTVWRCYLPLVARSVAR